MAFGDYQFEIYLQGLSGIVPSLPMSYAEWEAKAEAAMSPSIWSYVSGGAGDERTQRVNRTAFDGWGLMPRMFNAHRERDLSVQVFGLTLPSPVFMAPIGVTGLCAQDGHGDLATARAAARTGVPMVINTSYNDSEPIVCTPADAIVTFRKSGIDALFMDDVCLTAQS